MIYWDNNATTPMAPQVMQAMLPYLGERYFNPSAAYGAAREVRAAIEESREAVADLLGASPAEIIFTAGGTEATNTALRAMAQHGGMLVVATDHAATLQSAGMWGQVHECGVDAQGLVVQEQWERLCATTGLGGVSFACVNNETGVIQPIDELAGMARKYDLFVHLDAVQAVGKMPVDVHEAGVDFVSVAAHKIHGPKGTGCLYRRAGVPLLPLMSGGGQEDGLRSGTENVAGIIGFGVAARLAKQHVQERQHVAALRDLLEHTLLQALPDIEIHSVGAPRIPNTSNIAFSGCTAQALMLLLEPAGLLCAAGSACHSVQAEASHVLAAMGCSDAKARASLRFSLSPFVTKEEVLRGAHLIIQAVCKVRQVQSDRVGPVLVYKP